MAPPSGRTTRGERQPLPILTPAQLDRATPQEQAAYLRALELERALSSPLAYAQYVNPWVESQPHLEYLNRLIVLLTNDQLRHPETGKVVRRLAVSMPPRHGKSTVISEHTPPWAVSVWPHWRVILTSYEADFAAEWGGKARRILEGHPEFGLALAPDSRSNARWNLAEPYRGGMVTAGAGGPVTGKGAHLLIIDDPVKNAEEALSETMRQKMWDWYLSTAKTRLEPGGYQIILQTRWHEDDLLGRCLSKQGERWYSVNLPAIAMEDDPLGRAPGEPLCPAWYDQDALDEIRTDEEDGVWWSAMYQGMPTILGGGIFKDKHLRRWTNEGSNYALHGPADGGGETEYARREDCTRVQTVDLAATLKTTADFSVISTWDITPNRQAVLVDRVRERLESPDHLGWLIKHYRRLKPRYVLIERATYGLSLIQAGLRQGLPIRESVPDKDKVGRALPAGAAMAAGRVYFPHPREAPWIEVFIHEMLQFPNGTHDDQVDTLSMIVHEITVGPLSTPVRVPHRESDTLEARLDRWVKRHEKQKKRPRHPEMGRM